MVFERFRDLAVLMLVFLFGAFAISAQPDGYIEIKQLRGVSSDRLGCYREVDGVYDAAKLDDLVRDKTCNELVKGLNVDLTKETLIRYGAGSDCHMRVVAKVFRVDAEKKYKVIVNVIYGGCRAGGWRNGWIVLEKIPPEYSVENIEVRVDDVRARDLFNKIDFVFPKPPPTRTSTTIPIREIALNGCLPTIGQSRWIIQTKEHLENALDRQPAEKSRCVDQLSKFNIDFNTMTLVGYAFASGYCARPTGLAINAKGVTSTDPKENHVLINIGYDNPGEDTCKVWTTYQMWFLIPTPPKFYGIEFETRAK